MQGSCVPFVLILMKSQYLREKSTLISRFSCDFDLVLKFLIFAIRSLSFPLISNRSLRPLAVQLINNVTSNQSSNATWLQFDLHCGSSSEGKGERSLSLESNGQVGPGIMQVLSIKLLGAIWVYVGIERERDSFVWSYLSLPFSFLFTETSLAYSNYYIIYNGYQHFSRFLLNFVSLSLTFSTNVLRDVKCPLYFL